MKSKLYYALANLCKLKEGKLRVVKKYIFCLLVFLGLFLVGCEREGRDTYEVILTGDASSEYEWQYEENPEGIVENIRNELIELEDDGDEIKYSFVFSGKHRGETELVFSYKDESDEKIEKTVRIKLRVLKNNEIVEKEIEKSEDDIEIVIE